MTFFTIFSIVVIVLFITAMLAAAYFAIKAVLTGDVSQLVALAEMTTLPGPEKMAQVVASMYQHVPKAFRAILTEERLEAIAQGIFNWMRKYAEEYHVEKVYENADQMLELLRQNTELTALTNQLTTRLETMAVELHQKLVINLPARPPQS